jgi:hypothetical protein
MAVPMIGMVAGTATASTITFDEISGPSLFVETSPLTEQYSHLGIHFIPPGGYDRGSVLNDSTWSIRAHSGRNFLATNGSNTDNCPEGIIFDQLMNRVSVFAAGYNTTDRFRMTAFGQSGSVVDQVTMATKNWAEISVSHAGGIQRVLLENLTDGLFVCDDLSFAPVPEPATAGLLLASSLALLRRRQR